MKKKLLKMISVMLIMVLILTGCGATNTNTDSNGSSNGGSENVVKIGAVFPLSGSNALLGEESLRGAQLAVAEINANGGLWGKQVELVIADAPDVTAGQTEAERLITKDGCKLIFGAYSSSLANVVSDVCARNDVPYFEMGGIGSDVMKKGYKYLWRTCSDADAFGEWQAKFYDEAIAPKLGVDKATSVIVYAHEDSLYGTSVAESAIKKLIELGYSEANIHEIPYGASSVDLSSVILESKNYNPDLFLNVAYVNDAILIGRQAKELNFVPKAWIGAGGGWTMRNTQEGLGKETIQGIYNIDFPQYNMNTENDKGLVKYVATYNEAYKEQPRSGHSLANYVGTQMMLSILKDAGSLDKDAIYNAAYAKDEPAGTYTGGWGLKFESTGQNINANAVAFMWTEEKLEAVWPEEYAISDMVLPMITWDAKAKK